MGQTLSEPVTCKATTRHQNEFLCVGTSSMQGWRLNMEDAHTAKLNLGPENSECSFFAVFDGHGGSAIAKYCGSELHKRFVQRPEYQKGDIVDALKQSILSLDIEMLSDPNVKDEIAGSTAIIAVLKDNFLYVGNVGDSRAVACWSGGRVDVLSEDHKPCNELESKRIYAAGGWLEANRVNGNLALSRALGDFVFKRNDKLPPEDQIVTAVPDIETRKITDELEFIVLACDGIWDVMSNSEVVNFVRSRIAERMDPATICEELMTRCLAPDCQMGGLGADNMTVILVCNLNGQPYEKLAERCSTTHTVRSRSYSNGSSDSSCSTSCSSAEAISGDEDSPKFQKKAATNQVVNLINEQLNNEVKNVTESNGEHNDTN